MQKKYFIKQYSFEQYQHGGVGYSDIEIILQRNNYTPIEFPDHNDTGPIAKLRRFLFLYRSLRKLPSHAEVVFLYPAYARIIQHFISKLSKRKDIKLICIIGDIDGIKDDDSLQLKQEIKELKKFRHFIVHNKGMADWLANNVGQVNYGTLRFFDFLTAPATVSRLKTYAIAFAGNLNKSSFVHLLPGITAKQPALHFHIYGPGEIPVVPDRNIRYEGSYPPYQMPSVIKGSFGLIWDGPNPEQMEGSFASYMPYMTHHKLSLYILAELPVIAAGISASGQLVTQYQIGITVNSLAELQETIDNIPPAQYETMISNMRPLARAISEGKNLLAALGEIQ